MLILPRKNNDFCKIAVFEKGAKKHRFCLHFWRPKRRKFDPTSSSGTYVFSTSNSEYFFQFRLRFWSPQIVQKLLFFEKIEVRPRHVKHYGFRVAFWMDFCVLSARFLLIFGSPDTIFWLPVSRRIWTNTCEAVQVAGLALMIRATRGRSIDRYMDREDLIICVAFSENPKAIIVWPPLTSDDFRVGCIASRNKLRFASL